MSCSAGNEIPYTLAVPKQTSRPVVCEAQDPYFSTGVLKRRLVNARSPVRQPRSPYVMNRPTHNLLLGGASREYHNGLATRMNHSRGPVDRVPDCIIEDCTARGDEKQPLPTNRKWNAPDADRHLSSCAKHPCDGSYKGQAPQGSMSLLFGPLREQERGHIVPTQLRTDCEGLGRRPCDESVPIYKSSVGKGGHTRGRKSIDEVNSFPVPLPPPVHQRNTFSSNKQVLQRPSHRVAADGDDAKKQVTFAQGHASRTCAPNMRYSTLECLQQDSIGEVVRSGAHRAISTDSEMASLQCVSEGQSPVVFPESNSRSPSSRRNGVSFTTSSCQSDFANCCVSPKTDQHHRQADESTTDDHCPPAQSDEPSSDKPLVKGTPCETKDRVPSHYTSAVRLATLGSAGAGGMVVSPSSYLRVFSASVPSMASTKHGLHRRHHSRRSIPLTRKSAHTSSSECSSLPMRCTVVAAPSVNLLGTLEWKAGLATSPTCDNLPSDWFNRDGKTASTQAEGIKSTTSKVVTVLGSRHWGKGSQRGQPEQFQRTHGLSPVLERMEPVCKPATPADMQNDLTNRGRGGCSHGTQTDNCDDEQRRLSRDTQEAGIVPAVMEFAGPPRQSNNAVSHQSPLSDGCTTLLRCYDRRRLPKESHASDTEHNVLPEVQDSAKHDTSGPQSPMVGGAPPRNPRHCPKPATQSGASTQTVEKVATTGNARRASDMTLRTERGPLLDKLSTVPFPWWETTRLHSTQTAEMGRHQVHGAGKSTVQSDTQSSPRKALSLQWATGSPSTISAVSKGSPITHAAGSNGNNIACGFPSDPERRTTSLMTANARGSLPKGGSSWPPKHPFTITNGYHREPEKEESSEWVSLRPSPRQLHTVRLSARLTALDRAHEQAARPVAIATNSTSPSLKRGADDSTQPSSTCVVAGAPLCVLASRAAIQESRKTRSLSTNGDDSVAGEAADPCDPEENHRGICPFFSPTQHQPVVCQVCPDTGKWLSVPPRTPLKALSPLPTFDLCSLRPASGHAPSSFGRSPGNTPSYPQSFTGTVSEGVVDEAETGRQNGNTIDPRPPVLSAYDISGQYYATVSGHEVCTQSVLPSGHVFFSNKNVGGGGETPQPLPTRPTDEVEPHQAFPRNDSEGEGGAPFKNTSQMPCGDESPRPCNTVIHSAYHDGHLPTAKEPLQTYVLRPLKVLAFASVCTSSPLCAGPMAARRFRSLMGEDEFEGSDERGSKEIAEETADGGVSPLNGSCMKATEEKTCRRDRGIRRSCTPKAAPAPKCQVSGEEVGEVHLQKLADVPATGPIEPFQRPKRLLSRPGPSPCARHTFTFTSAFCPLKLEQCDTSGFSELLQSASFNDNSQSSSRCVLSHSSIVAAGCAGSFSTVESPTPISDPPRHSPVVHAHPREALTPTLRLQHETPHPTREQGDKVQIKTHCCGEHQAVKPAGDAMDFDYFPTAIEYLDETYTFTPLLSAPKSPFDNACPLLSSMGPFNGGATFSKVCIQLAGETRQDMARSPLWDLESVPNVCESDGDDFFRCHLLQ